MYYIIFDKLIDMNINIYCNKIHSFNIKKLFKILSTFVINLTLIFQKLSIILKKKSML